MEQALPTLILAAVVWTALLLARALQADWNAAPAPRPLLDRLRGVVATMRDDGRTVALTLPLGWVGGMLCGFLILLFGDYMARSGSAGSEYLGYWDPETAWFLARTYGSLVGALVAPAAGLSLLCGVPLARWSGLIAPVAAGTIAGGCLGALLAPPFAALFGCMGFWISCQWAVRRLKKTASPHER
jgi:hypothetical protein